MHPRLDIVILNRYNPTLASLLVGGCKGFSTGQVDHGGDVCDGGDGGDGGDGANVDGYGGNVMVVTVVMVVIVVMMKKVLVLNRSR